MTSVDKYLSYIKGVRRYSPRTVSAYETVLSDYVAYISGDCDISDELLSESLNPSQLRSYEVMLMDERKLVPKSVGRVKILARGRLTKALTVKAESFSVQAVKMIELMGGTVIILKD